jgi:hypothetical protein
MVNNLQVEESEEDDLGMEILTLRFPEEKKEDFFAKFASTDP